jgi:hypothetical protein
VKKSKENSHATGRKSRRAGSKNGSQVDSQLCRVSTCSCLLMRKPACVQGNPHSTIFVFLHLFVHIVARMYIFKARAVRYLGHRGERSNLAFPINVLTSESRRINLVHRDSCASLPVH